MEIYIHRNNEDFGPYSREVVLEYINQGVFQAQDYAAFVGMSEWKTLGKILGIKDPSKAAPAPAPDFNDILPPVLSRREHAVGFILRVCQATRHLLPSPAALPGPAALIRRLFITVSVVLFFAVGIYIYRAGHGSSVLSSPAAVPPAVASSQSGAPAVAPASQPAPPVAQAPAIPPSKSVIPGLEVTPVVADKAPATPLTSPAPVASSKAPIPGMEVTPVVAGNAPAPAVPAATPAAPAVQPVAVATPAAVPATQPLAVATTQAVTPAAQPTASVIPAAPVVTPAPSKPFNPADLAPFPAAWPRTVLLNQPVNFPAVFNGQIVGSLTVPAGTPVRLANIQGPYLILDFQGGAQRVPCQMTNLADEMVKSGWTAPPPAAPATTAANTAAPASN